MKSPSAILLCPCIVTLPSIPFVIGFTAIQPNNFIRQSIPQRLLTTRHSTNEPKSNSAPSNPAELQDRPLLRKFGRGIKERIEQSKNGHHRDGRHGAFTSTETIPLLNMQCRDATNIYKADRHLTLSTRRDIRKAFTESDNSNTLQSPHGRSSGSGCCIIRLGGEDAASIHGLMEYANRFFDRVDEVENNKVSDVGVFRIANHVYAGFDNDVNCEGRMQFLDTRIFTHRDENVSACLLPMELESLVGSKSLNDAHRGMNTLLDIGSQITSAVLGMDKPSGDKLIDDGTSVSSEESNPYSEGNVSNSYHRLIRYLKPNPNNEEAAFQAHVDSSFLTLIPMPDLPGLEVWCPSRNDNHAAHETRNHDVDNDGSITRDAGEWVRPSIAFQEYSKITKDDAFIIVMAGEFLQLTSNGKVPVCIHRVIPPKPPPGVCSNNDSTMSSSEYVSRVSAPLFLRPRRGKDALLNIDNDLKQANCPIYNSTLSNDYLPNNGLYHEEGLLKECDAMHLWSAHDMIFQYE